MDAPLEHVYGCDIDGQIEDLCRLATKACKVEERAAWLEVDQEIDVASGRRFTTRERSEDAYMTDPVSLGGVE